MKRMYWRPRRVSQTALTLIAALAVSGYAALVTFRVKTREPYYSEKRAAAEHAVKSFGAILETRLKRKLPIDPESDPAQTGLIGALVTPVTTNAGSLVSKQTSINPNFAAVVVEFAKELGLQRGDTVAVGYSGSFPALNVAVLAAVDALGLKPVIISSASSSQWGANQPEFLWLDMERALFDRGLIKHRSQAASIGGIEDRGFGIPKKGRTLIKNAIAKHELMLIDPPDFNESIETRMTLYRSLAADAPIRAYINVGGGAVSVGRKAGKRTFRPGVNRTNPAVNLPTDSVMGRMLADGVPVIHLIKVRDMAKRYGFPEAPLRTPAVGEGEIFVRTRISRPLVLGHLLLILGALYLFVRSDLGFRMVRVPIKSRRPAPPEQMV